MEIFAEVPGLPVLLACPPEPTFVGLIAGVFGVAAGSVGEGDTGTEVVFGSVDEGTGLGFGLLMMATVTVAAAPISATTIGTTIDFLSSATNSFPLFLQKHKDGINKTPKVGRFRSTVNARLQKIDFELLAVGYAFG